MKGYKATYNMKCQNLIYEVGKTYSIDKLRMCSCGFHFCEKLEQVFEYYQPSKDIVVLEVEALGKVIGYDNDKAATDKLKILRVVPKEEYKEWVEFDSSGNVIHWTNCWGFERFWEYDSNGNPIHFKNSDDRKQWLEYDSDGNMIHSRDSYGFESWNEYDERGNKIHSHNNSLYEESWQYDGRNNVIYYEHCLNVKVWKEYDFEGNLNHVKNNDGFECWMKNDENGNMIYYKDTRGLEWNITIE